MKPPLKIAHRGYSCQYKENTLGAFKQAVEHEFDMITLDVQLCKGNQLIVLHNSYLGSNMVEDLTIDEIRQYDPDILLLLDFFTKFNYKSISVILDMKGSDATAQVLRSFLIKYRIDTANLYFASFNGAHLDHLSDLPLKLGYLCENKLDLSMLNYIIRKYQPSFFAFSWTNVDADIIHYIHSQHKLVFSYPIENKTIMNYLNQLYLDGLITNILL